MRWKSRRSACGLGCSGFSDPRTVPTLTFFRRSCGIAAGILLAAGSSAETPSAETWRGLAVEPEQRCSKYRGSEYCYLPSVEPKIVAELGRIYSPYTGQCFETIWQTDIEHIVARSEAHDSGLCAADAATRRKFSSDPLNLTLASPELNRHQKRAHDAAGWVPEINRCWFAQRVLQVRLKYGLSIDRKEAKALEAVLSACDTTGLEPSSCPTISEVPLIHSAKTREKSKALRLWDDNQDGRITCREAQRHDIAPVLRGHPAYPFMDDSDGDCIDCRHKGPPNE